MTDPAHWFRTKPTEQYPDGSECPVHKRVHQSHGWYVCLPEIPNGKVVMSVETQTFVRKSFKVEAVRVDESNMEEIAEWCGGKIRTEPVKAEVGAEEKVAETAGRKFIKVKVKNPINDRQTKAFLGYWVLYTDERAGYKVYNDHAFQRSFDPVEEAKHEVDRSAETGQFVSAEEAAASPATTVHETTSS